MNRSSKLPPANSLQDALGYEFQDIALLEEALRHPSSANRAEPDNQRLEFLGDRVLSLTIADHLYATHPEAREGELHSRHIAMVCRGACAAAARLAGLGRYLVLSTGEEQSGGREKETVLADAMEAVVAAAYLDGGMRAARSIVERFWEQGLRKTAPPARNAKSELQEWTQKRGLGLPHYQTERESDTAFSAHVRVPPDLTAMASGETRREAERKAAHQLLGKIADGV